jgi:hypothetical protein
MTYNGNANDFLGPTGIGRGNYSTINMTENMYSNNLMTYNQQ